jgi:uncharacterized protein (DUF924 family)
MSTNEGFEDVLRFWFSSLPHGDHAAMARQMEWWFRGGADSEIVERFPPLLDRAKRGDLDSWSHSPRSRLALIIVLRPILTHAPSRDRSSVRAGSESSRPCSRRDRERSLRGARNTLGENLLLLASRPLRGSHKTGTGGQARGHRDIIERFGRHPHRNEVLGRKSTPEELDYLATDQLVHTRPLPS